jgi:dolichol-phosphate mannosyltransferase
MKSTRIQTKTRDLVVIIPTYCEKENIGSILPQVLSVIDCDILVVDDGSPDGTAQEVLAMSDRDSRISLLSREGKPRGLGRAYVDGFGFAMESGYSCVIQMDADFSHQPSSLTDLVEGLESADLVIGSRYVAGGGTEGFGRMRRFISQGGSWYARSVLGMPIRDVTGGFKCWRTEALSRLGLTSIESTGFSFQIEMNYRAHKAGLRIKEVPIQFSDREKGTSKMSGRIFLEGLFAVWRMRFSGWK